MDMLDSFGVPVAKYEGFGSLKWDQGKMDNVYFDMRQVQDGTIFVSIMASRQGSLLPVGNETGFQLTGETTQGWYLETSGPSLAKNSRISLPGTQQFAFLIQRLKVWKPGHDGPAGTAVFALANYLFGGGDDPPQEPLKLDLMGWQIELRPVKRYKAIARQLRDIGGIFVTAEAVASKSPHDAGLDFDAALPFLELLCWPLSLVGGSKVNWLWGEKKDPFDRPVVRIHQNSVTKPFSNQHEVQFNGWRPGMQRLLQGWFSQSTQPTDLSWAVDFYLDSCARGPYFETRALTAAAMLDALVNKLVPGNEWISGNRPNSQQVKKVKETLKTIRADVLPKVQEKVFREEFLESVVGLFRRPFRKRLTEAFTNLRIAAPDRSLSKIVQTRNALVHSGTFDSNNRGGWGEEYRRLLWANYCLILRLAGYPDLPPEPQ